MIARVGQSKGNEKLDIMPDSYLEGGSGKTRKITRNVQNSVNSCQELFNLNSYSKGVNKSREIMLNNFKVIKCDKNI